MGEKEILIGLILLGLVLLNGCDKPKSFLQEGIENRFRINVTRFSIEFEGVPCNDSFKEVWMGCDEYSCPCPDGCEEILSTGRILCGAKQTTESCRKAQKEYYEDQLHYDGSCKKITKEKYECAIQVKNGTIDWFEEIINWEIEYCEYWWEKRGGGGE